MSSALIQGVEWVADRWCYRMHPDPMWPVSGKYRCPKCLRVRPVPWANSLPVVPYSYRSARIGSMALARRAGRKPAPSATTASTQMAITPVRGSAAATPNN